MLHIYLIKVPAHASVKKMKEENWAMDGFVSIILYKPAADTNLCLGLSLKFLEKVSS